MLLDSRSEVVQRMDSNASSCSSWDTLPSENAVAIDMSIAGTESPQKEPVTSQEMAFISQMRSKMMEEVGGQVWAMGKQSASRFLDINANVDVLRPYFDVEPKDVLHRVLDSFTLKSISKPQSIVAELYGPVMMVFTLVAVLLFSMKLSGHVVREGTLMGTAIGVCFGYWFGISFLLYLFAYVCNTHISLLQTFCLNGYALASDCIVVFLSSLASHEGHSVFYVLWAVVGGLSALQMLTVLVSRTWSKRHGVMVGSSMACTHLLFILYLHFSYDPTVTERIAA